MNPFTVIYEFSEEFPITSWQFFECMADNADHAEEQCKNAYPNVTVLWVNEGHGPNSRTMEK